MISISFQAQIFQSNNPSLYISEGASITELNKDKDINKIEIKTGQIFVSKNALVYTLENTLSGKLVLIESSNKSSAKKRPLASNTNAKKIKSKKISKRNKRLDFNFVSGKSSYAFEIDSANGYFAISNTNSHIKAILTKSIFQNTNNINHYNSTIWYLKLENSFNDLVNYYSIRPPPNNYFLS